MSSECGASQWWPGDAIDLRRVVRCTRVVDRWPIQKERILSFAQKHRGRIVLDAIGAGDPIYDDLACVYPTIEPFKFTNHSKTELIQRLIVAVEQAKVFWPTAWEVLTNEMKRFEYAISSNGAITYNAPAGFHDDCVIALALANRLRNEYNSTGHMLAFEKKDRGAVLLLPQGHLL